jgi:hypothetical protein
MTAVTPVLLRDHLGVERELRFTPGARKRIAERFGTENLMQVSKDKGDWALYEAAYSMMYDKKGQPPEGLSLEEWMENCSGSETKELAAAILSAVSQGKTPKNEIMEMLEAAERGQIGLLSGPTVASASDSPTPSSGGDTPPPN